MSFLFWYILIQKIVDSSTFAVDTKQSHKVYLHDLVTCLTGWEWYSVVFNFGDNQLPHVQGFFLYHQIVQVFVQQNSCTVAVI